MKFIIACPNGAAIDILYFVKYKICFANVCWADVSRFRRGNGKGNQLQCDHATGEVCHLEQVLMDLCVHFTLLF